MQRLTLSQINRNQIAAQTGVDLAHISRIFTSTSDQWPSFALAFKISNTLGVTMDELHRFLSDDLMKPDPRARKQAANLERTLVSA